MIKQTQAICLALFLLACSNINAVDISTIVAQIQSMCGFVTSAEEVAKIAVSLVAGFNPALGASATVANGIANTIVDSVSTAMVKSEEKGANYDLVKKEWTSLTAALQEIKIQLKK
jgi:hypothetical protein